jgi:pimeloyl-ACP methyl ester carboxylesterase
VDLAHFGPYLAERGWRAVAPFTRGYAPTDLAPNDSQLISDQEADVLAVCNALGGDARAVLIGHHWGAAAVSGITARQPQRSRATSRSPCRRLQYFSSRSARFGPSGSERARYA